MSVSLMREGRLWGLIACHHYAGLHEPPYEACATAELLGQMLSVRVVEAWNQRRARDQLTARSVLAELAAQLQSPTVPLATALTEGVFTEMMAEVGEGQFDAMDPANVSPLVVWLGSAASAGVTGQLFEVEGGKIGVAPRLFLKKLVADVLDRVDLHEDFDPRRHYALTLAESEMSVVERAAASATSVDDIEL